MQASVSVWQKSERCWNAMRQQSQREQTEARNIAPLVRQTKRTAPDAERERERVDATSVRRVAVAFAQEGRFHALLVKRMRCDLLLSTSGALSAAAFIHPSASDLIASLQLAYCDAQAEEGCMAPQQQHAHNRQLFACSSESPLAARCLRLRGRANVRSGGGWQPLCSTNEVAHRSAHTASIRRAFSSPQ